MEEVPRAIPCGQVGCAEPATHRMFWPGRHASQPVCEAHRAKAVAIADACGFGLCVEDVEPYGVRLAGAHAAELAAATLERRPGRL